MPIGRLSVFALAPSFAATRLTPVYVSHSHPDHYFDFPALQAAFPEAKRVALPATVERIEKTWQTR